MLSPLRTGVTPVACGMLDVGAVVPEYLLWSTTVPGRPLRAGFCANLSKTIPDLGTFGFGTLPPTGAMSRAGDPGVASKKAAKQDAAGFMRIIGNGFQFGKAITSFCSKHQYNGHHRASSYNLLTLLPGH